MLITVDGVRVPDAFSFGAQSVGRGDYVDLDLLKSVEILRGPASALYGSDGVAGAVSFITKDPRDFLTDGKLVGGGLRSSYDFSDDSWTNGFVVAGRTGDLETMVAYSRTGDVHSRSRASARAHPNNLILGKSASPHHSPPSDEQTYQWHDLWGARHPTSRISRS